MQVASGALSGWSGSVNGLTKRVLQQLKPAFARLHAMQASPGGRHQAQQEQERRPQAVTDTEDL